MQVNNFKLHFAVLVCVLLGAFVPAMAQRPVVSAEIDTSGEIESFGPNRPLYEHGFFQFGVYTGPFDPGLKTNWWSTTLTYGGRTKFKICSWESLVLDFAYRYDRFSINQKQNKFLPLSPDKHQRERISIHSFSGAFCNRINFGRRGNILGNWLDLGVYADWNFRTANVYLEQYYISNSPTGYHYKNKTKISRLSYIEKWNYGFTVRAGRDFGGIFINYRITDLIKDSSTANYGDLPRLMIGIEVYSVGD